MVEKTEQTENPKSVSTQERLDALHRVVYDLQFAERDRVNLRGVLFDDKKMFRLEPGIVAINLIEQLRGDHKKDPSKLTHELRQSILSVNRWYPELAALIKNLDEKPQSPVIARIVSIIENYPVNRVYGHFSGYFDSYSRYLDQLNSPQAKTQILTGLKAFIIRFKPYDEIFRVLGTSRNQIQQWTENSDIHTCVTQGTAFAQKINQLSGNRQKAFDIPSIRQLLQYENEVTFFNSILEKIQRGQEEDAWDEFKEFYKHVKDISEQIKERFGDVKDEKILLETEKRVHESPTLWAKQINEIIADLESRKGDIILEAQKAFITALQQVGQEINIKANDSKEELKNKIMHFSKFDNTKITQKLKFLFNRTKKVKKALLARVRAKRKKIRELEQSKSEGKTFIQIRKEFAVMCTQLQQRTKLPAKVEEIMNSQKRVYDALSPLKAQAQALKSQNEGQMTEALSGLSGMIAGIGADEDNVKDTASELRSSIRSETEKVTPVGDELLNRTKQMVTVLNQLFTVQNAPIHQLPNQKVTSIYQLPKQKKVA